MIQDPYASLRDQVLDRVLQGAGECDLGVRNSVADASGVPADLQSLVEKIHCHAYRVTDDDIAELQSKYGDDQMFEIVVSVAMGASRQRLLAGLAALNEA